MASLGAYCNTIVYYIPTHACKLHIRNWDNVYQSIYVRLKEYIPCTYQCTKATPNKSVADFTLTCFENLMWKGGLFSTSLFIGLKKTVICRKSSNFPAFYKQ